MKISIGISARHVHLSKNVFNALFEEGTSLTKYMDIKQPGQYACVEKVNLITKKGRIDGVRIVGPLRKYTQVEISKTDSYLLGINPPIRSSGDLKGSETLKIEYNNRIIEVKECCIIANRHIHVNEYEANKYNLSDEQKVKLKINSEKGAILENVVVRVTENAHFEAHLDLDDANANLINSGDLGEIIYE